MFSVWPELSLIVPGRIGSGALLRDIILDAKAIDGRANLENARFYLSSIRYPFFLRFYFLYNLPVRVMVLSVVILYIITFVYYCRSAVLFLAGTVL